MYFENNPATPFLYKGKHALSFGDKINILFLDVDLEKVCTKRPNGVHEHVCFVIDRSQLKNAEDWLVTDAGSFQNLGASARVFHIENGLIVHSEQIRGKKSSQLKRSKGEYLVRNVYRTNTRSIQISLEQQQRFRTKRRRITAWPSGVPFFGYRTFSEPTQKSAFRQELCPDGTVNEKSNSRKSKKSQRALEYFR